MFGIKNPGWLSKKPNKSIYDNSESLVDIEFGNRTNKVKNVWIEPTCEEFDIEPQTEYKILTHDNFFHIAFTSDDSITFYLQYSFGFKLYKRPVSNEARNPNEWELVINISE
jgi:hypothetical protein